MQGEIVVELPGRTPDHPRVHGRRETGRERSAACRGAPPIVYTLGSLDIGGAELRSLELIEALKRRHPGLSVILYISCRDGGPLEPAFRGLGVPIVQGRRGLAGIIDLWRLCRRSGAAILHTNADTVSGFYCFAAALAGVKVRIAHYRSAGPPVAQLRQRLILHTGRLLLRLSASRVVGVCDSARAMAGVKPGKWLTLYNGIIRDDGAAPPRPGRPSLLFLGRIHPDKRPAKAVDILDALMARSGARASLHFVGSGSPAEMGRLRARIDASPFASAIIVHGFSREPREHLRRAGVLLLPSSREGLPGAVLEALAEGVAVVASDLPGIREIQGFCPGVYCVVGDAPAAIWADAVEEALAQARPDDIRAGFRESPFHFADHVRGFERLWALSGGSGDAGEA
jgi:glycosyltransferase involved in cell wall biosynthesis